MKNKLYFLVMIFMIFFIQKSLCASNLNTNVWDYNPANYPNAVESLIITGGVSQDIVVNLKLAKDMSGIAAGLLLNGVDVLAGKSAAGCAWQTSYLVKVPPSNDVYVFNQSCGNSTPFNWGFSNLFVKNQGVNIAATNWISIYADHYHPTGNFESTVVLCPGYGYTSVAVDKGHGRIDLSKIPVSVGGNVIKIKNTYTHKAMVDQNWSLFTLEQAFYMYRLIAKNNDLHVYLGYNNSGVNTQVYDVFLGGDDYSVPSSIVYQNETIPNKSYKIKPGLEYAVFVWNISGKAIAVAIDIPNGDPFSFGGAHLNMERTAYGSDSNDYSNGNISFHPWIIDETGSITFSKDETNDYYMNYYVGTPEQLIELGYETNTLQSAILFDDPYSVTGGGDANFQYDTRQSGSSAPVQYQVVNGPITVTNVGPNAGKLNVLSGSGVVSYWNIANHNFTESSDFSIECEVDRLDGADNFHWFEVSIGCDGAWQNPEDNAAYRGLSVKLWEQGQLVTYTNGNSTAMINQTFNELKVSVNQKIKVRIVVSQSDFSGSGDAKIALFINDKALPLSSDGYPYTLILPGGFVNNYINFRVGEANVNFDNLKVLTPPDNVITTAVWTSDADSEIFYTNTYTHTVNLADTADIVINGQTFIGAGITTMSGSSWELRTADGNPLNSFASANPNVAPASKNILTNFLYPTSANNAASLTLTGLTSGQEYILTLYSMGFEGAGSRRSYIATSDGAVIANIDQDEFGANNGQLLTYRYTANADGVFSVSTTPINNPWHFYAFSNKKVIPVPEPAFIGFIIFGVIILAKRKL